MLNLTQLDKAVERQLKNSYQIKYITDSYQTAVVKSGLDNYPGQSFKRKVKRQFLFF
ncbi:MAG: hypothetical protein JWR38_4063 [Mucilaginibacter sp.]|nr:hypothetical protein [Mucilaginibacter sp.]